MIEFKNIIFDLDGVICTTDKYHFVEENHSLSEWIKGLSYGQIKTPVI